MLKKLSLLKKNAVKFVLIQTCERVTNKFVEIFDEIGARIYKSTIKREEVENKKYELENVLKELEKKMMKKKKKINEDIDLMKSEIDFTKTQYEQLTNENMKLRKELEQKTNLIGQLENKLNQLKKLIGKLTEVRVILNKYFSSHFENFTQQEREIIQNMQNYRALNNEPKYKEAMNELLESGEYDV